MNGYVIQHTGHDFTLYVGPERALSGNTRYLNDAKVWKTAAGAQRWLADRSGFPGRVVEVVMVKTLRGKMVPKVEA
jgi:hypothetical protein